MAHFGLYRQRVAALCAEIAAGGGMHAVLAQAEVQGCLPSAQVLNTAARTGDLETTQALIHSGCRIDGALAAAGEGGQAHVIRHLAQHGFIAGVPLAVGLVRGGHARMLRAFAQALADVMPPGEPILPTSKSQRCELLVEAASSRPLPELEALWDAFPPDAFGGAGAGLVGLEQGGGATWSTFPLQKEHILAAAAGSTTADWKEKVEWLERKGCRPSASAVECAASTPDAAQRLQWLWSRRGYEIEDGAALAAARAGNHDALQLMMHLPGIRVAHAVGAAAAAGHLQLVLWMHAELGAQLDANMFSDIFDAAAGSGNVHLLEALYAAGLRWSGPRAFANAAAAGSAAPLQMLAAWDCPAGASGAAYTEAVNNGDVATVHFLAATLGCPWGFEGAVFRQAVSGVVSRRVHWSMLSRLLQAGCPSGLSSQARAAVLQLQEYPGGPEGGHHIWEMLAAEGML